MSSMQICQRHITHHLDSKHNLQLYNLPGHDMNLEVQMKSQGSDDQAVFQRDKFSKEMKDCFVRTLRNFLTMQEETVKCCTDCDDQGTHCEVKKQGGPSDSTSPFHYCPSCICQQQFLMLFILCSQVHCSIVCKHCLSIPWSSP
jgi:hypothetical protein